MQARQHTATTRAEVRLAVDHAKKKGYDDDDVRDIALQALCALWHSPSAERMVQRTPPFVRELVTRCTNPSRGARPSFTSIAEVGARRLRTNTSVVYCTRSFGLRLRALGKMEHSERDKRRFL